MDNMLSMILFQNCGLQWKNGPFTSDSDSGLEVSGPLPCDPSCLFLAHLCRVSAVSAPSPSGCTVLLTDASSGSGTALPMLGELEKNTFFGMNFSETVQQFKVMMQTLLCQR